MKWPYSSAMTFVVLFLFLIVIANTVFTDERDTVRKHRKHRYTRKKRTLRSYVPNSVKRPASQALSWLWERKKMCSRPVMTIMSRFWIAAMTLLEGLTKASTKQPTRHDRHTRIARTHHGERASHRRCTKLFALAVLVGNEAVAMENRVEASSPARMSRVDTDPSPIGIDNRRSTCMSDTLTDFKLETLREAKNCVKGVGKAMISGVQIGAMALKFEDDEGMVHAFEITGSHYMPTIGTSQFSPKHFSESRNDKLPLPFGTKSTTYYNTSVLK
jgi:hypothetical protein